jgi:hypothetical protein
LVLLAGQIALDSGSMQLRDTTSTAAQLAVCERHCAAVARSVGARDVIARVLYVDGTRVQTTLSRDVGIAVDALPRGALTELQCMYLCDESGERADATRR